MMGCGFAYGLTRLVNSRRVAQIGAVAYLRSAKLNGVRMALPQNRRATLYATGLQRAER
jgi:hypothetical protein